MHLSAFRMMDEAGREIELSSKVASKVKVNWTPKLNSETVAKGLLPDVKVPNSSSDSKYCHVSLADGSGLDFAFTIK